MCNKSYTNLYKHPSQNWNNLKKNLNSLYELKTIKRSSPSCIGISVCKVCKTYEHAYRHPYGNMNFPPFKTNDLTIYKILTYFWNYCNNSGLEHRGTAPYTLLTYTFSFLFNVRRLDVLIEKVFFSLKCS